MFLLWGEELDTPVVSLCLLILLPIHLRKVIRKSLSRAQRNSTKVFQEVQEGSEGFISRGSEGGGSEGEGLFSSCSTFEIHRGMLSDKVETLSFSF